MQDAPELKLQIPLVTAVTDTQSPTSVVNMVPKVVGRKILALMQGELVKELLSLDETRLAKELKRRGYRPTRTDNFVRVQFWNEYMHARTNGPPYVIQVERIFSRVCTQEVFYNFYLLSPLPLAWILCPPVHLDLELKEALSFGVQELRSFFEIDIDFEKGSCNAKTNMKLGAFRALAEVAGLITDKGKLKKVAKNQETVLEAKRMITEADLEERKKLIEKKLADQNRSAESGTKS